MIMQIMLNFSQLVLVWHMIPYSLSFYQIWSHLDKWKQSYGPKKSENFSWCTSVCGKMGYGIPHSFTHWTWLTQYKCTQIFQTSTWNLQSNLIMGLFTLCHNFVKKIVNLTTCIKYVQYRLRVCSTGWGTPEIQAKDVQYRLRHTRNTG